MCKVEEELLDLPGLMVSRGLLGRFKCCTEAKLTTARIIYMCGSDTTIIPLSSIRHCQLKKSAFDDYLSINCTDDVYHLKCDIGIDLLYQTLMDTIKHYETYNIIEYSEALGGISRLLNMKDDRKEVLNKLQRDAMADLMSLKQKSKRMLEVALRLQTEERPLSKTFLALQLNEESEAGIPKYDGADVEHIMITLMKGSGIVLLRDLFCAVNRMLLCNFITPQKLLEDVQSLEEKGICKIVDLQGVVAILSKDTVSYFRQIVEAVSKGPITFLEFAEMENIPIHMAEYVLLYAEMEGLVTRDDGLHNVKYYSNPFN